VNSKVIDLLNQARGRELHAILQYMDEHYELDDAGYGKLADRIKEIAIVEMKHAEQLGERIVFLGGQPIFKPDDEVRKGLDIPAMIKVNIALEDEAVKLYNEAANTCAAENDNVSRELFEDLLEAEDGHLDEFQKISDRIEKLGDVYIATLTD